MAMASYMLAAVHGTAATCRAAALQEITHGKLIDLLLPLMA
jgi:hypothetical protein